MREVAVLGLGRFGMNLARDLADTGVKVLAIDRRKDLVADLADHPQIDTAILDITDQEALHHLDLSPMSASVVAIGEGFEAAVLATYHLREIAKDNNMKVIARAQTPMQAEILRRVGADVVFQPESEFARLVARRIANPELEDYLELDERHGMAKIVAPAEFVGQTLSECLRNRYHVNLVSVKRPIPGESGWRVIAVPADSDTIEKGDVLVLVGEHQSLKELPRD